MDIVERTPAEVLGHLTDLEEKNAPARLFLAGNPDLLRVGPRIAVVGSRRASPEGVRRARALTIALVNHQMVVVSGLAEGIDTVAHQTALEAGGKTIAVIGTPLQQSYPAGNAALQARMAREQLVVSQFPAGSPFQPRNFPIRNRTMALLTDATVIVEASEKSGTLHQGWEALRLGRTLFLMESVANDPSLSWPAEMIRYGAQVLTRGNLEVSLENVPAVTTSSLEPLSDFA